MGDIHGRADLLDPLLQAISDDSGTALPCVVFLGDVVDRGPDSREAMDLVCHALARWPRSRLIRGNHDHWFLQFMTGRGGDAGRFARWLFRTGGDATLRSYGLAGAHDLSEAASRFRNEFPVHLDALMTSASIIVDKDVAYAHAGVDPRRPLHDQDPRDLMMIRQGFLDYEGAISHIVVHGHTPCEQPEVREFRIGIDTGAYATGILTCLALPEEGDTYFIQAVRRHARVTVRRVGLNHSIATGRNATWALTR
ncbi:metallophosphoesterase [Aquibium carbonis]|uniref:metallophosphoesterase n=1 Tax=Aquibium carbonis TaxID=2495581 RepID=UPI001478516F|nr:metallophosphoesterase [Aquibium carbonis]